MRLLLLVLFATGTILAIQNSKSRRAAADGAESLASLIGLMPNQVTVTGYEHVLVEDVFKALAIDPKASILSIDPGAARARLKQLAWVRDAEITRVLPDAIEVRLHEHKPFAVWQHRQLLFLIDSEGRTLEPAVPNEHRDLPLVVGDGAAEKAGEIIGLVDRYPEIARRFQAAVRVSERRWTIKLADGPDLELSSEDPAQSLERIIRLERDQRLLDRAIDAIDLRMPDRVVLRLSRGAEGLMAERRNALKAAGKPVAQNGGA